MSKHSRPTVTQTPAIPLGDALCRLSCHKAPERGVVQRGSVHALVKKIDGKSTEIKEVETACMVHMRAGGRDYYISELPRAKKSCRGPVKDVVRGGDGKRREA
ncbi:hypothetical protein EYF80_006007 [Liparis tanakae]|uniref:Uncharacterized protein n=1 Tax=Liparis tanakae TaxID=230148 RepID=A0A4Z2J1I1_9TELE|nr:hypothetical protein EYF80_006007 [Liparis tanakae]